MAAITHASLYVNQDIFSLSASGMHHLEFQLAGPP